MPGLKLDKSEFRVKENSWLAGIAAWKLGSNAVAMVLGKTIHLHHISKADFLQNKRLFRHELCHVRQYQQHGFIWFLVQYLWESVRKGYYHNKFEVEARKAEAEESP
jgi:Domain of unknown function (DUF4157)